MSNPFFTNKNWLLITDSPVLGKSIQDFKPTNLSAPYSVWGIPREGPIYEELISCFESSLKRIIESQKHLDDRPFTLEQQNELLINLKSKIDYYILNRPDPVDGYEISMLSTPILIDVRNNAVWDRPLSKMINLYELIFNANQVNATIYLNID